MARDIFLERLNEELQDLEQDYKSVKEDLRCELDGSTKNRLERRLEKIGREIDKKEQEITDRKQQSDLNFAKAQSQALIAILEIHPDELAVMKDAYQKTLIHRPCNVKPYELAAQTIIAALEGILPSSQFFYPASDEFVARLIQCTDSLVLKQELAQWIKQYRKELDWSLIQKEIDTFDETVGKSYKPGLLIDIALDEEMSTQEEQKYYRLLAWWIKDIQEGLEKRTYIRLIEPSTADSGPFLLERLPDEILTLFGRFIEQKNHYCGQTRKDPEIHIFLPLSLLDHEVDLWPCSQAESLGKECEVMIHCAERYQNSYRKRSTWLRLWDQHTQSLRSIAFDVFIERDQDNLDDLQERIDQALEDYVEAGSPAYVGLKLASPPCVFDVEDIFGLWLALGLPLGIWSRCELQENGHRTQLDELLQTDCLEKLPKTVHKRRQKDQKSQSTKDCCIGHHLALLWDDPTLSPPSALPQAG